jgi:HAD superfamily hydrolase (TIGR01509 family)
MIHTPEKKIHFPRAVLFDYDGVLVASEPIHLSAWKQVLVEIGLPPDIEFVQRNIGKTAPYIMKELLDHYRPGWSHNEFDVESLARRKNVHYLATAQRELQAYPSAHQGVRWLREKGVRTAIVSNAKRSELHQTLNQLGLFDLFDQIVSRDDVGIAKPDPTPYLFAAACLNAEPHECIAVEDSPTGLESALMGKIPSAGILTNFSKSALEAPVPGRPDLKPIWIGPSLEDFFNWLRTFST